MNLSKIVEFIFVLMVLVFLAIFIIFITLCLEVYTFLTNIETSLTFRIVTMVVMAFTFLYILRGIILRAEDFHDFYDHEEKI